MKYVIKCVNDSTWIKTFPDITYTQNESEALQLDRQQAAEIAVLCQWKYKKTFIITSK